MKNTSNTMFKIGTVFNIIGFIVSICVIIAGPFLLIFGAINENNDMMKSGRKCIFYGLHFLVAFALSMKYTKQSRQQLNYGPNGNLANYITAMVFGTLSCIPFVVIGGVLAMVYDIQQTHKENKQAAISELEPEPEPEPEPEFVEEPDEVK